MYLSFPSKYQVNIHDDKTGLVVSTNMIPEQIEQAYFQGQDQFIVYSAKRIFVYKKVPRSNHFTLVQTRFKNI